MTAASRTTALIAWSLASGLSSVMPVPSGWTGSLLEWAKAVAGWKLMPVPLTLKGMLAAWLNFSGAASSRPVPAIRRRDRCRRCRADCVPTLVTVTVSIPWSDAVDVQSDLVADRDVGDG